MAAQHSEADFTRKPNNDESGRPLVLQSEHGMRGAWSQGRAALPRSINVTSQTHPYLVTAVASDGGRHGDRGADVLTRRSKPLARKGKTLLQGREHRMVTNGTIKSPSETLNIHSGQLSWLSKK
jgi:hypothetical protein